MNGEEKMFAIFGCCFAFMVASISASISFYKTSVDTAAIKAGLVQDVVGSSILWVEPTNRRTTNE